jgi:preprotein translocase subunit YajC
MSPFHPIFAQVGGAGSGSLTPLLFQFALIFAIFYFLMIRPQQQQRKKHEQAILDLKKGDEIVTAGGLVGEVVHIKEGLKDGKPARTLEDRVTVRSGESKVVIERGRVAKVLGSNGSESKA